ncbi:MAG: DUF4870 domain-containing protein, partial [Actinomycetota bacterium]|nr:DUF4870 domain-containing protein [Actinomycetota bacterium]
PPPGPPGYGPPGYGPPPGPPGYGPPGYGPPPGPPGYGAQGVFNVGVPTQDERTWAMLSHLSYFVLGLIGPLIVMLTKGNESPFVRDQAVEALNFHITLLIAFIVSFILAFIVIGIFTAIATFVVGVVYTILAAIAAYRGEAYHYPFALRLVK